MRKGRFGPYAQHGKTVANLPRGVAMEDITLDEAVALLAEKGKALKPRGGPARKGRPGAKATAPAKSAAPRKAPAKQAAAKPKKTGAKKAGPAARKTAADAEARGWNSKAQCLDPDGFTHPHAGRACAPSCEARYSGEPSA